MSQRIEDGGPAYPVVESFLERQYGREAHRFTHDVTTVGGMSLRDWFAGQALAGSSVSEFADDQFRLLAKRSYAIADAMIAARQMGAQTGGEA